MIVYTVTLSITFGADIRSGSGLGYLYNTQRGRSRAQHARDHKADIERAKKWRVVRGAFATHHRRGPQGQAHIWVVFLCKGGERGAWRGPKGRADEPIFWWRLIKNAKF